MRRPQPAAHGEGAAADCYSLAARHADVKQRLQAGGKSLVRGVRQQYADAFLSATGRAGRSEACCGLLHFSPKVRATVTGLVGGAVDTASPNAETLPPDVPYGALVQHMRGGTCGAKTSRQTSAPTYLPKHGGSGGGGGSSGVGGWW